MQLVSGPYMIWDDHEIANGWGSNKEHSQDTKYKRVSFKLQIWKPWNIQERHQRSVVNPA